jgi:MFS family permease
MLALAGLPALLVWFIRRYVPEPPEISAHLEARRERKRLGTMVAHDRFALRRLIEAPLRRPMLVCTALATGALIAFWSVTTWYPQLIRQITAAEALPNGIADHRVAMAAMLFNAGGIVGYASWGFIADAIGRRKAFLLSFAVSAVAVAWVFPFDRSYTEYLIALPFLGFGLFGALSGTFIYAPELFPPSVRATALAVCNSVGRYVTALGPLTAGTIATSWVDGNLGLATASVTALGLIAVVGLAFARETRGEPMPSDPAIHLTEKSES